MYISDCLNNRLRKVVPATSIISTIAGSGEGSYSGDNGQATSATLNQPTGVAVDSSGKISLTVVIDNYFSDNYLSTRQFVH